MPSAEAPQTIAAYIADEPAPVRTVLRQVRAAIRKALPRAEEGISYRIPVYKVDGRMVLYFAAFKDHYSIYPATARLIRELGPKLGDRLHNKATIRFSYDEKVPTALITRIARLRAAEAKERGAARNRAKTRRA